ncbi:bifunctional folylpolyglutamate synthase/dihydrofolate synthase [Caproiciproducens sp. AGMB10547]|uniref:tetrahydrofolate synthase n=2 Tax=Caproiciproducens faecalis TaxID=2820301 RepID=A0ABS7DR43_9FIRM|nr:bifunctional folylpolyglutamate synthase/dihydrofolate synthase [Caproiciproducens faecalis]
MTYEEALKKIESLLRFGSKPGLDRVQKLLSLLGNPQDKLKFIHVAGTNGKGSTCALVASVLKKSQYKTGLFISPFVTDFCERMQINGEMIGHEELSALVEKIFPLVEQMAANGEIITEFELITALAMEWFAQEQCDVVVLEVGLGGRLDATNVISTPLVSVITSISLDHTAILGDTLAKIAYEKCGIIKDNGVTVCYPGQNPEALAVIRSTAEERKNRLVIADTDSVEVLSMNISGTGLEYRGLLVSLPFIGEHQIKNAVTALAVIEELKKMGYHIADHSIEAGFSSASFPARMEVLSADPLIVLDGAHNPDGTAALAGAVKKYLGNKKIIAIAGMLADKDVSGAVGNFTGLFSRVFTLAPNSPRALDAKALAEKFQSIGANAEPTENADAALAKALSLLNADSALLICGSLYLAGDIRPRVLELLHTK